MRKHYDVEKHMDAEKQLKTAQLSWVSAPPRG